MDSVAISMKNQIGDRQKNIISEQSGNSAIVVGLGGIGSWIALDAALIGMGIIYMFDDDIIEASNLNRTPYRIGDIGKLKIDAMEELIKERRPDVLIVKYNRRFTIEDYRTFCNKITFLFDCSDTTKLKDAIKGVRGSSIRSSTYFKLGYDGMEGTISVNDFDTGQWGEDNNYAVTPSFVGTPQVISAIVITMAGTMQVHKQTVNFNLNHLLPKLKSTRLDKTYSTYSPIESKVEHEPTLWDPLFMADSTTDIPDSSTISGDLAEPSRNNIARAAQQIRGQRPTVTTPQIPVDYTTGIIRAYTSPMIGRSPWIINNEGVQRVNEEESQEDNRQENNQEENSEGVTNA